MLSPRQKYYQNNSWLRANRDLIGKVSERDVIQEKVEDPTVVPWRCNVPNTYSKPLTVTKS